MAETFESRVVTLANGEVDLMAPVSFQGRLSETDFERAIIRAPKALGEELLVLGQQLADFSEDQQRLDVLAIDKSGEIVLIELKVTDSFGLTDVQALAYAGAYADLPTSHYVGTLRRALSGDSGQAFREMTGLPEDATTEQVKDTIVSFLEIEDFASWEPSQQIRIKLVAPGFPQRVLKSVKWLGDIYGMPIEAIRVQLFDRQGTYEFMCERLLPLPGEELFDMTVRERERQRREKNEGRRRRERIFSLLVQHGLLKDGDVLFLTKNALRLEHREHHDPDNIAFRGTVKVDSPPKLIWRGTQDGEEEEIAPAALAHRAMQAVLGEEIERFGIPVAYNFTVGADGPSLADLAAANGLWESAPE